MKTVRQGYRSHESIPIRVLKVDKNAKWECCKCGWIGTHGESSDKTPIINDA